MSEGFALRVDDDLRTYLKEIAAQLGQAADAEDRELQVQNALEELEGKELKVATDAECSRILETLLRAAPSETVVGVVERMSQRDTLYTVACNPFGSHVLETLLLELQRVVREGFPEQLANAVTELAFLLKEDLADYISHKYGTFFARKFLQFLTTGIDASPFSPSAPAHQPASGLADKIHGIQTRSGNTVISGDTKHSTGKAGDAAGEAEAGGEGGQGAPKDEVAREAFQGHVRTFVNVLVGPQFDSDSLVTLTRSASASPFLQALLHAAAFDSELSAALFLRLLNVTPEAGEAPRAAIGRLDTGKLIAQMKNKSSSHMVEALVAACPPALYDALWAALQPHFAQLCLNPVANFAAQAVIAAAPAGRCVTDAFHAVKAVLPDVVRNRRTGVACVLLVAAAAWRVSCEDMCAAVQDIFPDSVIDGLVCLDQGTSLAAIAAERDAKRPPRLSINGCIMLQAMLAMPQSACKAVTDALLDLPERELRAIAQDSAGARVLEAFLKGTAPKPMKRKLLVKLQEHYGHLAALAAPSRLVEALFVWGEVADKEAIVGALAPSFKALHGSKYGHAICNVCQLEIWLRSPDEWRRKMTDCERMAAQFKRLFGDAAKGKKERRKKKKKEAHSGHMRDALEGTEWAACKRQRVEETLGAVVDGDMAGAARPGAKKQLEQAGSGSKRKARAAAPEAQAAEAPSGSAADVATEVLAELGIEQPKGASSKAAAPKNAKRAGRNEQATGGKGKKRGRPDSGVEATMEPKRQARREKRAAKKKDGSQEAGAGAEAAPRAVAPHKLKQAAKKAKKAAEQTQAGLDA